MNKLLDQVRTSGKQILAGFTPGQKAVTAVAVLGVLIGGWLFTSWAGKPAYAPLFTGLEPAAAAEVTEALNAAGTPYQLANGGTSILVPQDAVYESRIALSGAGLPSSAENGWGILDDQGITASEFRQRIDFQRALQGELRKTITSIDGVADATVHLVIPKEDLFTEDAQKATASVLVRMKRDATMNARQVQSVVNLVASSVEGLTPDNVTVSDGAGNLLSAPGEDGADMAAGDFRAQQTAAYERRTADKVRQLLSSFVGPTGADVTVHAELNFDDREETSETFGEDGKVIRSTETKETFQGTSTPPGGVLGPQGGPLEGGDNNQYEKGAREEERAIDKTITRAKQAPGGVVRQSISVVVDAERIGGIPIATLEEQVAAAAGINAARGDVLSVARGKFDTSLADEAKAAEDKAAADAARQNMMDGIRTVGTILLVGLGLMLGYRRMRRPIEEESIPLEHLALHSGEELLEIDEDDIVEMEPARDLAALDGGFEDPTTVLVSRRHRRELDRLPGVEEREAAHADIADLIDRQPDDVAQLLRGWMAERR